MKNRFRGLSESRKLEMLQMSVEEIYDAGYEDGRDEKPFNGNPVPFHPVKKTPNQRRAELIQRARAFVEKQLSFDITILRKEMYRYCNAEFIVNTEKRTVVCLLKGRQTNSVWSKAKTKCHPGEVFNADIGKAIALARALEIEIPQEFLSAVQPDYWAVGQEVKSMKLNEVRTVTRLGIGTVDDNKGGFWHISRLNEGRVVIVNDTHAEYPEVFTC